MDPPGAVERYRRRRSFRRLKSPREKVPSSRRLLSHNEADTFDSLYTLDVTTSVATLVGSNGSVVGTGIGGLMYLGDATYVSEPTTFACSALLSLVWASRGADKPLDLFPYRDLKAAAREARSSAYSTDENPLSSARNLPKILPNSAIGTFPGSPFSYCGMFLTFSAGVRTHSKPDSTMDQRKYDR